LKTETKKQKYYLPPSYTNPKSPKCQEISFKMWAALNDTTIGPAVKDYCSGNPILKEQVMEKFGPILNWNTDSVTSMAGLFNNIDCQ
jgi:hypothetical protein